MKNGPCPLQGRRTGVVPPSFQAMAIGAACSMWPVTGPTGPAYAPVEFRWPAPGWFSPGPCRTGLSASAGLSGDGPAATRPDRRRGASIDERRI